MSPKWLRIFSIILISLVNYQLAKVCQHIILKLLPGFPYIIALSLPWLLLSAVLVFSQSESGIEFNVQPIRRNQKNLLFLLAGTGVGLLLFILLGITKHFHAVEYPIFFFLITPIIEELIFRGWVYGQVNKLKIGSPILISSLFFALHHLQYTNYNIGLFVGFQIAYTFILGLLLGNMRKFSGSVYLGILVHMLINFLSVKF